MKVVLNWAVRLYIRAVVVLEERIGVAALEAVGIEEDSCLLHGYT
jgi:hypothetical protein